MLKKILEILRKLGILRYGSSSYSGDAKDRPVSMMLEDIYSDKDLTFNKDLTKEKETKKQEK